MKTRIIVFMLAMLTIAATFSVWQGPTTASADNGSRQNKQERERKPQLRPGWPKQGSIVLEVTSRPGQNSVSQTFDGPFGPVTVELTSSPVTSSAPTGLVTGAVTAAYTEYSRSCTSTYRFGISARYTIYVNFRYNYSSVTWMGKTTDSAWSIPAFWWDNRTTWNDWSYGWRYAWGNGRATLKWGVGWASTTTGRVHNNVMVDAWGNCTARQYFNWG